ncbi:SMC-Scp complex subunit ScpB [Salibacterium qingdaonense]|uniref:Segregation and condensation protein B n=1 Tax=Salibacterium qingdaonense TaxID=266892 RepID=A0A1I4M8D3_9BACI|nr:SMC-Scp complex subunit ScpB [Salibacterium qingdaonense]SFL99197.1 segregation and condensation protein B [Salibacterium qingdaonense]
MSEENYQHILQGLLYVCGDEGLELQDAAGVLDLTEQETKQQLLLLQQSMKDDVPGLQVQCFGTRFQLVTADSIAPYIEKLAEGPRQAKLSQAALETLAIISYNQPITRIEIDDIRGVKSERAVQTLIHKALVQESGRAQAPGRPILYKTTERFLEHFNISSLEELPALGAEPEEPSTEEADLFFKELEDEN